MEHLLTTIQPILLVVIGTASGFVGHWISKRGQDNAAKQADIEFKLKDRTQRWSELTTTLSWQKDRISELERLNHDFQVESTRRFNGITAHQRWDRKVIGLLDKNNLPYDDPPGLDG